MQREISNVAKVCRLPGFRYIAFAPLVVPERVRPVADAAAERPVLESAPDEPAPVVQASPAQATPDPAPVAADTLVAEPAQPRLPDVPPQVTALPPRAARPAYALLDDIDRTILAGRGPASVVSLRPQPMPQAVARASAAPRFALLGEVAAMLAADQSPAAPPAAEADEPVAASRPRAARKRSGRVA